MSSGPRSAREQEDHDLDVDAAEEIMSKYFSGAPKLQLNGPKDVL